MNTYETSLRRAYALLNLDRNIAGVRLLKTEEDFEKAPGIVTPKPMNYCLMVASATKGHVIKAKETNIKCRSGVRVLGINPADPLNGNGENWARLGLYKDSEISRQVRKELSYVTEKHTGVVVGDAYRLEEIDVFIIVANAYSCMRILQGYAYSYGMPHQINMLGNQALCLECTARPYVTGDINLSMLCIGTRHRANWADHEMAVGIPAERFETVINGIYQTANIMESNANKQRIAQHFSELPNDTIQLQQNYNYYMDC